MSPAMRSKIMPLSCNTFQCSRPIHAVFLYAVWVYIALLYVKRTAFCTEPTLEYVFEKQISAFTSSWSSERRLNNFLYTGMSRVQAE